jgi:hypothetical protein
MRRVTELLTSPEMSTVSEVVGRVPLSQMEEFMREHPPVSVVHHSDTVVLKVTVAPKRGEARSSRERKSRITIAKGEERERKRSSVATLHQTRRGRKGVLNSNKGSVT